MKRKLLFAAALVLSSVATWATDYLTDISQYSISSDSYSKSVKGTTQEFWNGKVLSFDVSATETSLPNGVYSFSVQALYRGHLTKDIPTGIIAYAESDGNQYMTPIANITDGSLTGTNPNHEGISTAFNANPNDYLNTIPYIIVTDGKIKVGVKSMSTQPCCGNGFLFLYNQSSLKLSDEVGAEVLTIALSDVKAQANGLLASNEETSEARTALETAVNSANATAGDIVSLKQKINAYLAYLTENATEAVPNDVSYYFTNPKYSIRNLDLVGGLVTSGKQGALGQPFGWTCYDAGGTGDDGSGNAFQDGQGFNWFSVIGNNTELDGQAPNYDADKTGGYSIYNRIAWNKWAEQTHSAKQTVTLPKGKYKLSVPAYASINNDDYKGYVIFNINGEEFNNDVTAGGWNIYEKEFTLFKTAEISVDLQFNKLQRTQELPKQYAYFDGVTLTAYGLPLDEVKTRLAELQGAIDGYLDNALYTNVTGSERDALSDAKDIAAKEESVAGYEEAIAAVEAAINAFTTAKELYETYNATVSSVTFDELPYADEELYDAFQKAVEEAAISADDAAEKTVAIRKYVESNSLAEGIENSTVIDNLIVNPNFENGTEGWTLLGSGGSLEIRTNEPLTGADGNPVSNYIDANNNDNNTRGISQTITLPRGKYLFSVSSRGAATIKQFKLEVGDEKVEMARFGSSGQVFGRGWNDYTLEYTQYIDGEVTIKVASYDNGGGDANKSPGWWSATRFRLVKIDDATVSAEVTNAGAATYVTPTAVNFDADGVEAYVVSSIEDGVAKLTEVTEAPANTPVILVGAANIYEFTPVKEATLNVDNRLKASEGGEKGDNIYVLANLDNGVGFYALEEGETLPAGKAYLTDVQGIKFIGFSFGDDATGIKGVETATEAENVVIYNLAGQRVANPTKGIYIVNGKKVLVK